MKNRVIFIHTKRDNMDSSLQIYNAKSQHSKESVCQVSTESVSPLTGDTGAYRMTNTHTLTDRHPDTNYMGTHSWATNC